MKPVLLCILDGVGIREDSHGNAFKNAYKPNFNYLFKNYPKTLLNASQQYVGLPHGQMGNSEVGHTNIGAGRVVYQSLELINKSFKEGIIEENNNLQNIFEYVKKNNVKLHIMGLVSDGGIHSHINHFNDIVLLARNNNIDNIYAHVITDGRDTPPNSSINFINTINNCKIASISGRYYAMDRDKRYERTDLYFNIVTKGIANNIDVENYINNSYLVNETDEFIKPNLFLTDGIINKEDALIWINFRKDRAYQIIKKLEDYGVNILTMMPISNDIKSPFIVKPEKIENTFGKVISRLGYKQLRISETEKYAHVTYFFDGGVELKLKGCDKILIPSPKVSTYDLKPGMSAFEITERLISEIKKDKYDFIILNFANGDMVGHTGNYEKCVDAIEKVDACLGQIINIMKEKKGLLIVTADHGNCEEMLTENNEIITSHSLNKVPFIIMKKGLELKEEGSLCHIAPTILKLMNIEIPKEMTKETLIKDN